MCDIFLCLTSSGDFVDIDILDIYSMFNLKKPADEMDKMSNKLNEIHGFR